MLTMPNTNISQWQKPFLKKLFPTLNSNRNGKTWSWERHFLLWKCCYWQPLKVGSRDLINVIYFLLLLRTRATLEWNGYELWESATINLSPSNESTQRGILEQCFEMGRVNLGCGLQGPCVSVPFCFCNQSHVTLCLRNSFPAKLSGNHSLWYLPKGIWLINTFTECCS